MQQFLHALDEITSPYAQYLDRGSMGRNITFRSPSALGIPKTLGAISLLSKSHQLETGLMLTGSKQASHDSIMTKYD